MLLLLIAVTVLFTARAVVQYQPLTYLIGDCPYYAATAVSLWYDGDLDLRNQLPGGLAVHGRDIALAADGTWYPKHPILMPVTAIPFLVALGMPGLLVFNLVVLTALAVTMMRLALPFAPPQAAALAAFLLVVGTFLRRYEYNFSPDLFATLLLTMGLVLIVRGRDGAAGLIMGLAVAAKLSHLFLLPIGLAYAAWTRKGPGLLRAVTGAAGPLLAVGVLNLVLFGSPLVTSYDRNVTVEDDAVVASSHRGYFDNPLLDGLAGELLDRRHGLIPTAPILWLAIPGMVLLLRRHPREGVLLLVVAEFLLLFFATYRYWAASHYGNRFLMPVVAVSAPAVALTLVRIGELLRTAVSRCRRGRIAAGAAS